MARPELSFSLELCAKISGMRLGCLYMTPVKVCNDSVLVEKEILQLGTYIKDKFSKSAPAENPVVSAVRRMYRRVGWEPTQYRPSSEALVRRILQNKNLYRVNNLVDLGNVVSARFHIPMGLYDAQKISGLVTADIGQEGEEYQGIFKDVIHAQGKLILRDTQGIFGNPTADSLRTSLNDSTQEILAIFFSPPEVTRDYLFETLGMLSELYQKECPAARPELFDVLTPA